jgi:elongation factor G
MAEIDTAHLRTVALLGHGGAGKTTLAEALLAAAGAIRSPGTVERGTTTSDHDPLEKTWKHSLRTSVLHLETNGTRVHLLDTPGFPDFIGQSIEALDAVETAAVVVNAQLGIEMITSRMMQWAADRKLCRILIVNKIDADNVDLAALLARLREAFGAEVLPINLPAGNGTRVVDCFFNPQGESDFSSVAEAHRALIDQVVEVDEAVMNAYLEQGDAAPESLHAPFEQALREGHLVPVCFVSAQNGAGVPQLLELFDRLLPNPAEGNPPLFYRDDSDEPFHSEPDAAKHVLAHVFKVVMDPFVGKLGIFRVHQGTLRRDAQLFVGEARKPFKASHLYMLQGKTMVEVPQLVPGDIGAVAKVDEIAFDSVLHDSHDEDRIHMRPLAFPTPMFGLAIEPRRRGDEGRISEVLHKLAAEDPTLAIDHDAAQHETVVRGLGELHLRSVLERMTTQFKLEVDTRPPRIPYRETITANAEGQHRHKKQTGGAGQFGEVHLRIEPLARGEGFRFDDAVKGGTIPSQFIPAVQKGIEQALAHGPLAGYPMHDLRVVVHDGKHHPVDSKEVAFSAAGRKAFLEAVDKARPILLEPVVSVEVLCPSDTVGDVSGDLSGRRGHITGTQSPSANTAAIEALVPLSELEGYASRLNSLTGGRGSYSMQLAHYDPVPAALAQKLVAEYRATRKQAEDE